MSGFLDYTHCYCEENIYRLLAKSKVLGDENTPFDKFYAVLFSSYATAVLQEVVNDWDSLVPYRRYESDDQKDMMLWDYHVVAFVRSRSTTKWYAIDFDSQLPSQNPPTEDLGRWQSYCVDMFLYIKKTFMFETEGVFRHMDELGKALDQVRLRVMERDEYLAILRTDRSHMIDERGEYNAPPPLQPIISHAPEGTPRDLLERYATVEGTLGPEKKKNNLVCLINMRNTTISDTVVDRRLLARHFALIS